MAKRKASATALALTSATLVDFAPARLRRATVIVEAGQIAALAAPSRSAARRRRDARLRRPAPSARLRLRAHPSLLGARPRHAAAARARPRTSPRSSSGCGGSSIARSTPKRSSFRRWSARSRRRSAGTTTLVDHHASPALHRRLARPGRAARSSRSALRGVLCYEVTDRDGARRSARRRARKRSLPHPLAEAAAAAPARPGRRARRLHALGRDRGALADVGDAPRARACTSTSPRTRSTRTRAVRSTVSWLAGRGLLGPRALLAHGSTSDERRAPRFARRARTWSHNPRSNLNNAVGYARPSRFGDRLLARHRRHRRRHARRGAGRLLRRARSPRSRSIRRPRSRATATAPPGSSTRSFAIEPGAAADLIALDYRSPTPLDDSNLAGHLLFGLPSAARCATWSSRAGWSCGGAATPTLDEAAIYARAREAARRLWSRLSTATASGTSLRPASSRRVARSPG